MINKIAVVVTLVLVLLFGALIFLAVHYYGKYAVALKDNLTLTQDNENAALVITNQARFMTIFNTIARGTINAQANNTAASHDRQVVIQTIIKTEPCAATPVPAAASDILLKHYNEVRANTGDADTVQPDSAVSSQSATK